MSKFQAICDTLLSSDPDVSEGPMMSAPGIRYKNKVFCFYHEDRMCFKLGKDYDLEAHGISEFGFLSPFKNKPPMKGWYFINEDDASHWDDLAAVALEKMMKQLNK